MGAFNKTFKFCLI